MSIDTGLGTTTYNANYPLPGVSQPTQQFRLNFAVIKAALEFLQNAASASGSVLRLTTVQSTEDGSISYNITFDGNAFKLPVGNPTIPAAAGMIRYNGGATQVHNGSTWVTLAASGNLTAGAGLSGGGATGSNITISLDADISDLNNVTLVDLADGDTLVYQSGEWVNLPVGTISSDLVTYGASNVEDILDQIGANLVDFDDRVTAVETDVASAVSDSSSALTIAGDANTTAETANDTANAATTLVNAATTLATTAAEDAADALAIASSLDTDVATALADSAEALSTANSAAATATNAETAADAATIASGLATTASDAATDAVAALSIEVADLSEAVSDIAPDVLTANTNAANALDIVTTVETGLADLADEVASLVSDVATAGTNAANALDIASNASDAVAAIEDDVATALTNSASALSATAATPLFIKTPVTYVVGTDYSTLALALADLATKVILAKVTLTCAAGNIAISSPFSITKDLSKVFIEPSSTATTTITESTAITPGATYFYTLVLDVANSAGFVVNDFANVRDLTGTGLFGNCNGLWKITGVSAGEIQLEVYSRTDITTATITGGTVEAFGSSITSSGGAFALVGGKLGGVSVPLIGGGSGIGVSVDVNSSLGDGTAAIRTNGFATGIENLGQTKAAIVASKATRGLVNKGEHVGTITTTGCSTSGVESDFGRISTSKIVVAGNATGVTNTNQSRFNAKSATGIISGNTANQFVSSAASSSNLTGLTVTCSPPANSLSLDGSINIA